MGREIERKFLVDIQQWDPGTWPKHEIVQGYLMTDPRGVLRVRRMDGQGILSLKMRIAGSSRSRDEFEYEIPPEDTEALLRLCPRGVTKVRHKVVHEGRIWEVDVFGGALKGLILAELELGSEDETFVTPPFVGREVTEDPGYSNSSLAREGFLEEDGPKK